MKIKHLNNSLICIILLFLSGCVGPLTQSLNEKIRYHDPEPEQYIAAFKSNSEIYLKYKPSPPSPSKEHEAIVSTEYWAVLPINRKAYEERRMSFGWDIYRNGAPFILIINTGSDHIV